MPWRRKPLPSPPLAPSPAWELRSRDVASEPLPDEHDAVVFETPQAAEINRARLDHLEWMNLPLTGRRVLDVGGGVGHLAQFFVRRGCTVVCTDAREQNVETMRRLYPGMRGELADVEDDLSHLGTFEVVFCYGLLYHLESPIRALRNIHAVCSDLLLIETIVCDSKLPLMALEDEYLSDNQALRGLAHRPSPAYVAMALDRIGFHHVYSAAAPPEHEDYVFERLDDLAAARDGHNLRQVFVASRAAIENERLVPLVVPA